MNKKEKEKQKEKWKGQRRKLHAETEKEERKIKASAKRKIKIRSAGLKVMLAGLLASAAGKDGKLSYREMRKRADTGLIADMNRQIAEYNRKHPEKRMQVLPPTAVRADVADAAVDMAVRETAADLQGDLGQHIKQTAVRAYTETAGFFSEDALSPYLAEVTEEWAKEQSLKVCELLDESLAGNGEKFKLILKRGYAQGRTYQDMVEEAVEKFEGLTETRAYLVTYTEGTRVMAEASARAVTDQGYTQYSLSTVGDEKVCQICRDLEPQVFRFADRDPGVNFPPIHPMCRCTFYVKMGKGEDEE